MILNCPNCKAKYFVKDDIVGVSGTDVTCPSCTHQWFQMPSRDALLPIKVKGGDQIYIEQQLAVQTLKIEQGKRVIWSIAACVALLSVVWMYAARNTVVTHWDHAGSAYKLFSIEVNRYGVEWVGLDQKRTFDGTRPIVAVSGVIKNMTQGERKLPLVAIHLQDEHGDTIETRYAEFPYASLNPSERLRVKFDVENPPTESTEAVLAFVDAIPSMQIQIIPIEDSTH